MKEIIALRGRDGIFIALIRTYVISFARHLQTAGPKCIPSNFFDEATQYIVAVHAHALHGLLISGDQKKVPRIEEDQARSSRSTTETEFGA
jgi:hypothetical protein